MQRGSAQDLTPAVHLPLIVEPPAAHGHRLAIELSRHELRRLRPCQRCAVERHRSR